MSQERSPEFSQQFADIKISYDNYKITLSDILDSEEISNLTDSTRIINQFQKCINSVSQQFKVALELGLKVVLKSCFTCISPLELRIFLAIHTVKKLSKTLEALVHFPVVLIDQWL